ncbi:MAG TPA: hypothetical protein VK157_11585, partial [Phycisphaerales bacterium]|nr:hypothetical protein [Phycisphaerales bacterium]
MRVVASLVSGASLIVVAGAWAGISQANAPTPGGFVQSVVYSQSSGCGPRPGADLLTLCGPTFQLDAEELAYTGMSSASSSAAGSLPPVFVSTRGTAEFGRVRMSSRCECTSFTLFASALTHGGWNETFTISHPALTGQSGFFVFKARARASLITTGLAGSAYVGVAVYKDNATILRNSLFSNGNADPIGASDQYVQWGLASFGVPDSRIVDGNATFAVPIVFGTPFKLGVYAIGGAGQRASGGNSPVPQVGDVDANGDGVSWDGIVSVNAAGGQVVSGYTIVSGSGKDWTGSFAACDDIDFNNNG